MVALSNPDQLEHFAKLPARTSPPGPEAVPKKPQVVCNLLDTRCRWQEIEPLVVSTESIECVLDRNRVFRRKAVFGN